MTIVKVQRPLMTNGDEVQYWLIYDKGRKYSWHVPEIEVPQHVHDAMGDDYKAYFKGQWSDVFGWGLSQRVNDEDW